MQLQSESVHTGNQAADLQEAPGWAGGVAPWGAEPPSRRQEVSPVEEIFFYYFSFDTLAPPCVCKSAGSLVTRINKRLHFVSKQYCVYSTFMWTLRRGLVIWLKCPIYLNISIYIYRYLYISHFISWHDIHHDITDFVTKWQHCQICIINNYVNEISTFAYRCCGRRITLWERQKALKTPYLCFRLFLFLLHILTTIYSILFHELSCHFEKLCQTEVQLYFNDNIFAFLSSEKVCHQVVTAFDDAAA